MTLKINLDLANNVKGALVSKIDATHKSMNELEIMAHDTAVHCLLHSCLHDGTMINRFYEGLGKSGQDAFRRWIKVHTEFKDNLGDMVNWIGVKNNKLYVKSGEEFAAARKETAGKIDAILSGKSYLQKSASNGDADLKFITRDDLIESVLRLHDAKNTDSKRIMYGEAERKILEGAVAALKAERARQELLAAKAKEALNKAADAYIAEHSAKPEATPAAAQVQTARQRRAAA